MPDTPALPPSVNDGRTLGGAGFTPKRSLVRTQYRPPAAPQARLLTCANREEAVHSRRSPGQDGVARALELDDFGIDGSRRWLRDRSSALAIFWGLRQLRQERCLSHHQAGSG